MGADRADEYLEYLKRTGVADYTATPGNHGVQILTRTHDGRTDFTILSYWESLDAIKAFAGDDPEASRFYPEDDRYLVERDEQCHHWEVVRQAGG